MSIILESAWNAYLLNGYSYLRTETLCPFDAEINIEKRKQEYLIVFVVAFVTWQYFHNWRVYDIILHKQRLHNASGGIVGCINDIFVYGLVKRTAIS